MRRVRLCGNRPWLALVLMVPGPFLVQLITPSDPWWLQGVLLLSMWDQFFIVVMVLVGLWQLLCSRYLCLWMGHGFLACIAMGKIGGIVWRRGGWCNCLSWRWTTSTSGNLWKLCLACRGVQVPCIRKSMPGWLRYPKQVVLHRKFQSWDVVANLFNLVHALRSCLVLCKVWGWTVLRPISMRT